MSTQSIRMHLTQNGIEIALLLINFRSRHQELKTVRANIIEVFVVRIYENPATFRIIQFARVIVILYNIFSACIAPNDRHSSSKEKEKGRSPSRLVVSIHLCGSEIIGIPPLHPPYVVNDYLLDSAVLDAGFGFLHSEGLPA